MKKVPWKSMLTLALILLVLCLVFREHYQEILQNLRGVPLWGTALLFGLALVYQGLESAICLCLVHTRLPDFTFSQAFTVTFLGVFGNVATFAAGSIPMQSYYLHQYGLMVGQGIGIMTVEYIFHKASIFFYATIMLLLQGRWLQNTGPDLFHYLVLGFGLCAVIIAVLVLLCTWEKLKALALRGIALLPDTERWARRKEAWRTNLEALHAEARHVLKSPPRCGQILVLNALKLFFLYLTVYLTFRFLAVPSPSLWQVQLLAALMLVITSALPNVAGIGPTELAFLLIFAHYAGETPASSALILYRTATYFFPFAFSCLILLRAQRNGKISAQRKKLCQ